MKRSQSCKVAGYRITRQAAAGVLQQHVAAAADACAKFKLCCFVACFALRSLLRSFAALFEGLKHYQWINENVFCRRKIVVLLSVCCGMQPTRLTRLQHTRLTSSWPAVLCHSQLSFVHWKRDSFGIMWKTGRGGQGRRLPGDMFDLHKITGST